MGQGTPNADQDGVTDYPYNGTWSGQFYNGRTDDETTLNVVEGPTTHSPNSVAGTFGVTMEDDATTTMVDETASFVGAFGAHRDE